MNNQYSLSSAQVFVVTMMLLGAIYVEGYATDSPRFPKTSSTQELLSTRSVQKDNDNAFGIAPSRKRSSSVKYDLGLGKNHPVVPFGVQKKQRKTKSKLQTNALKSHLNGAEENDDIVENNAYTAARFWIEHESVNALPSPLDSKKEQEEEQQHHHQRKLFKENYENMKQFSLSKEMQNAPNQEPNNKKIKRSVIRPLPNRVLEDILTIMDGAHVVDHSTTAISSSETSLSTSNSDTVVAFHQYSKPNDNAVKLDLNTIWVEMLIHEEQKLAFAKKQF